MRIHHKYVVLISIFALVLVGCGTPAVTVGTSSAEGHSEDNSAEAVAEHTADAEHGGSEHSESAKGSATQGTLVITDAYARATTTGEEHSDTANSATDDHADHNTTPEATAAAMDMGGVSAAYMTIENTGANSDRLISASTAVAGMVELHESVVVDEVARMQPLVDGVEIAAHATAELKPGGKHIMLMNLKQPLVPGETISLTLNFESGSTITLEVPILAN